MAAEQLHFFGQEESKDQGKGRAIIAIPLDTLLLSGIALILLLVLFFSLGVEKGKKNALMHIEQAQEVRLAKSQELAARGASLDAAANLSDSPVAVPASKVVETSRPVNVANQESIKNTIPLNSQVNSAKYAIQIASFQKESAANEEAKKFERKGLTVMVSKKGKFFAVCVGAFNDYSEAQKQLEAMRKSYKDCFLRRL